jgi:hypothetical protein
MLMTVFDIVRASPAGECPVPQTPRSPRAQGVHLQQKHGNSAAYCREVLKFFTDADAILA